MREKSDKLEIRIEPELKEEFFEVCRERAINPSELLRREIKKIIKNFKKGIDTSGHI